MTLEQYRNNLKPYDQRIFDEMYDSFVGTVIQLMVEADVTDDTITTVISNHWDISTDEIMSILHNAKINHAVFLLEKYMKQNGYTDSMIKDFMQKNIVKTRLRNEPALLMQGKKPEKIYKSVQPKKISMEK